MSDKKIFHPFAFFKSKTIGELQARVKKLEEEFCRLRGYGTDVHRLAVIIRDSNDAITEQDMEGNIAAWNRGAEKIYGYAEEEALTMNIKEITPADKQAELAEFMENLRQGHLVDSFETRRLCKEGTCLDIWLTVTPLKGEDGEIRAIATTERDITQIKRREAALEEAVTSLQRALSEVKTLQGILPICSFCKKIRNDSGYYEQLEDYFHNHAEVDFSHTICPACARLHYPQYADKIIGKDLDKKG